MEQARGQQPQECPSFAHRLILGFLGYDYKPVVAMLKLGQSLWQGLVGYLGSRVLLCTDNRVSCIISCDYCFWLCLSI